MSIAKLPLAQNQSNSESALHPFTASTHNLPVAAPESYRLFSGSLARFPMRAWCVGSRLLPRAPGGGKSQHSGGGGRLHANDRHHPIVLVPEKQKSVLPASSLVVRGEHSAAAEQRRRILHDAARRQAGTGIGDRRYGLRRCSDPIRIPRVGGGHRHDRTKQDSG